MPQRVRQSVAVSLAICLLLLSGAIYAQTVPHTLHHAQHKAGTHSTALCTWLCAAGQVLDGTTMVLQTGEGPVTTYWARPSSDPISISHPTTSVRGPPSLSL